MTGTEGLTAVLLQLAGIARQLADLDNRQISDMAASRNRVDGLTALVGELRSEVASHGEALATVEQLDARLADLAGRFGGPDADDQIGYQPSASPPLWKLDGAERDTVIAKLRAWVEQVYRPGYGHLAADLGDCWEQHPLCLYVLDWLSELWSLLYLQPGRTAGTLAGQAEWHSRLLPAAAGQLAQETRRCNHQRIPEPGAQWSEVRA